MPEFRESEVAIALPANADRATCHMANTVLWAEGGPAVMPRPVLFMAPGGGYSRRYYAMAFDETDSYNEARFHAARGAVVVMMDYLDAGESHAEGEPHSLETIADTHDATVATLKARLATGMLADGLPPLDAIRAIGVGQSMGAALTMVTQARHRTFDGVALLGIGAAGVVMPRRPGTPADAPIDFIYAFHSSATPRELIARDMEGGYIERKRVPPFGTKRVPAFSWDLLDPERLKPFAAAIDVPLFLVFGGEKDVSADPYAEPGYYRACPSVALSLYPDMAHMHNFAPTRRALWEDLQHWIGAPALGREG